MPYEISGSYAFCQPTKSVAPKMYDFSGVMRYGGYALGGSQLYVPHRRAPGGRYVQQTPSRSRSGRLRVLRVLRRPQILRITGRLYMLRVLWRLDNLGIQRRLHLLGRLHVLRVLRCPRIVLRRSRGLRVLRRFVGRRCGLLLPALVYVSPLRGEEFGECDAALCGSEAFFEADDLLGLRLEVEGVALRGIGLAA